MSVCDPETGMHGLFRGYVPQQVFVALPRPTYDELCTSSDLDQVRSVLEQQGERLVTVILEPVVQGAGGYAVLLPAYLRQLVERCRSYGLLVISDEIATRFGRTGTLFAMEHAGVVPDVL